MIRGKCYLCRSCRHVLGREHPHAICSCVGLSLPLGSDTCWAEPRDAAGVEFPCGEMAGGESRVTPREQAAPITGAITVIVRDPDKEGFPEIRRYKVNPPANYAGRTVGISIVPGGQYHASLDGQVYFTYTPPEAPITTNPVPQPVAPAAPAAAPAPAPAAAPAPAPAPAGV